MATFFISDMHFGENQYTQSNYVEGRTLRRPFADAKEMDEAIIRRWNETVSDGDKVWVLGDMGKSVISKLKLLRGEKNLVAGNIDDIGAAFKSGLFSKIITAAGWANATGLKGLLLSHIPVHPTQLGNLRNVHGHTHAESVGDPRYICVSVDQIDYRPIALEQVVRRLDAAK